MSANRHHHIWLSALLIAASAASAALAACGPPPRPAGWGEEEPTGVKLVGCEDPGDDPLNIAVCRHQSGLAHCAIDEANPAFEAVETRCDGIDNDCDGLVDVLLPVTENACKSGKSGACGSGFATCTGDERVCLTPAAVAEAKDGIDNDCNGKVDDVKATARPMRLRVMIPPYMKNEGENPAISDLVSGIVGQAGIPFDIDTEEFDWEAGFFDLDKYSVVLMPGYLLNFPFGANDIAKLEEFVKGGGVVIWTKLVAGDTAVWLNTLAGVTSFEKRSDITRIELEGNTPATLYLDSPEERSLLLSTDTDAMEVETFVYELDPTKDTEVWGRAYAGDKGDKEVGATMIRRKIGAGAVYVLGHDPLDFTEFRCYINCFDPGRDVMVMLLRALYREGGQGHYVVKHTVPGTQSGVLVLSHDVDAPDAYNAGVWGEPGVIQMATMEKALGTRGSYNMTTDYLADYYNPAIVKELCNLGMCPDGGHSVVHANMSQLPLGDCDVTKDTYDPDNPTLCGEILVSLQLLRKELPDGAVVRSWRTPLLQIQHDIFEILYEQGIYYDSSMSTGALRSNFPVSLEKFPYLQAQLARKPMFEFPITIEDGIGEPVDGVPYRVELSAITQAKFQTLWRNALLQNTRNGAWTVLLVHPSYGYTGVGPANLAVKVEATKNLIEFALENDVLPEQLTPLGDFWRGRDGVTIEGAAYDSSKGYTGTLQVGKVTAPSFSLEFGDDLKSFTCAGAGEVTIDKNRVVFTKNLKPGTKCDFKAVVN